MSDDDVRVRGGASDEELAAVLAVVRARGGADAEPDPYRRWRAARLHALRHAAVPARPI